jgi:hypothetical protein
MTFLVVVRAKIFFLHVPRGAFHSHDLLNCQEKNRAAEEKFYFRTRASVYKSVEPFR